MAEVPLHGERNNCSYDGIVYATKMGILEVLYVAKSSNKPIVDVGPGERSLNGLQQKAAQGLPLTSRGSRGRLT
jgi:hypothetical protein